MILFGGVFILWILNGLVTVTESVSCKELVSEGDPSDFCDTYCKSGNIHKKCKSECDVVCGGQSQNGDGGDCNGIEPCVEMAQANAQFKQCCVKAEVPVKCQAYCRYNVTKMEAEMALLLKHCPDTALHPCISCASNHKDNTDCCKTKGVFKKNGDLCKPVCFPDGDDWPGTKKAAKKLNPCLDEITPIMTCHWASIKN